jgi:cytochrome P450
MDPQNYEDPQDFNPSRWDVSGLLVCKKKKKKFLFGRYYTFSFSFFFIFL